MGRLHKDPTDKKPCELLKKFKRKSPQEQNAILERVGAKLSTYQLEKARGVIEMKKHNRRNH